MAERVFKLWYENVQSGREIAVQKLREPQAEKVRSILRNEWAHLREVLQVVKVEAMFRMDCASRRFDQSGGIEAPAGGLKSGDDIIAALDNSGLTVRKAAAATGFAAADFSRVRNANLDRFTVDRLVRMAAALRDAAGSSASERARLPALVEDRRTTVTPSPEPPSVVVDKSYAQGIGSLLELHGQWRLLFPDAFFFEVASTDAGARERCLSKLRELHRHNAVRVAPNVGEMLRREIHRLGPAGPPSENLIHGLDLNTFFGMRFHDLSAARRKALLSTETSFDRDVDGLIARVNMLQGRVGGITQGTTDQRKAAFRAARQTVAEDQDFISRFFADFVCRGDHAPGASLLAEVARSDTFGPDWTIYRWVQVQLLYGLDLVERHGPLAADALTSKQRERLQHDVTDIEYVVLGVLQGALATNDRRMCAMFTLLRPDGALLTTVAS